MLKSHWRLISWIARIGDNALICVAFFLSFHFRSQVFSVFDGVLPDAPQLGSLENYFIVLGVALPLYNAFLSILGAYRSMRLSSTWLLFKMALFSSALTFLSTGSLLYMLKADLSRSFIGTFCLVSGLLIFIERALILEFLRYFRVRGKNFRNLLIVGTGEQAKKLFKEVSSQAELGVRVIGFVNTELEEDKPPLSVVSSIVNSAANYAASSVPSVEQTLRIVANPATFEAALKKYAIDEVIFTDIIKSYAVVEDLTTVCVEEGVRVTLAADLFSLEIFKSDISYFGETPLIHYEPSPGAAADSVSLIVKRGFDVTISSALLLLTSPLLIAVAVLIKFDSPGPVLFRQKRVGRNGRLFRLYKFRSMVRNAESLKSKLAAQNEMKGPVFKIKDDPRVTKLGRWLRKYSIDELPQLLNVLKGDMSLVGPRPPLPNEVSLYKRKQRRRLSMRPGLTCTWQVSGRNEIPDFEEWAKMDLEYIDNWSLMSDLKLLLKTIPVVIVGNGAR